jgi:hypothetical protein
LAIALWDITDWTIAERVKPKMRGQSISQNMLKDMYNAWPILLRSEARTGVSFIPTIYEVYRLCKVAYLSVSCGIPLKVASK